MATPTADPDRARLERIRASIAERAAAAENGIVTCIALGRCGWQDDRVRRHRADLDLALRELAVIDRAIAAFDAMESEIGGRP